MKPILTSILLLPLLATCVHAAGTGTTLPQDVAKRQAAILKDPSLLRYYHFDGSQTVPDESGKGGPLAFSPSPPPGDTPQAVETAVGRASGAKAVHLDAGSMMGESVTLPNRAFTVEAWFRKNGPGTLHGNSDATNGTLLSLGGGYWDGWRLTTGYPDRRINFEIGRPQPSSAIGVSTGPISDRTWHHLAATWDGSEMRVYLDGLPAASAPYNGPFTPPTGDPHFRVGFAGYGWGSLNMDVDEVLSWSRARSAAEIVQDASGSEGIPAAAATHFNAAAQHRAAKDWAGAAADYAAILDESGIPSGTRIAARTGLADALQGEAHWSEAAAAYVQVLEASGTPEGLRGAAVEGLLESLPHTPAGLVPNSVYTTILAMDTLLPEQKRAAHLGLARSLRRTRDFDGAERQYRAILADASLPPQQRLDVELELGDSLLQAEHMVAAQREYARVENGAPPEYIALATLRTAAADTQGKNFALARADYERLRDAPNTPAHFRWVASERLRQLARIQGGQPAIDLAWSQTPIPPVQTVLTFYVAPGGSDANLGTKALPFATLAHARDFIRRTRAQGGLQRGAIRVILRGGLYPIKETFMLDAADGGTADTPIFYEAAPGETVRLTGGTRLSGFKPVTDRRILASLPQEAQGKVFQIDLRALGITDYGQVAPSGRRPELFFNGRPMPLARYPNNGYLQIGDLVGGQIVSSYAGPGSSVGKFAYDGDRPARWKAEKDPWLYGYWFWDWADGYEKIESIDTEKRILSLALPYSSYGYRKGQRYYALNLLSELDSPGEWYLDRETGILYFYPPSDPTAATVEFSLIEAPLVQLKNVSNVTLGGLTLEDGRGNAVEMTGSDHCLVRDCIVRRFGGDGVTIAGGTDCGILGCDIYTLGRCGTRVSGGDRKTLAPGGHFVENCHIYDFSRVDRTYTPAVWLDGVGNRVVHNVFHDSPHQAMRIEGNDHLIEFNEIYNVVTDSDDQGGLDAWNNPSYRGNIVRYNFWHDIGSGIGLGQAGVRLDDAISGYTIYGNVFYRCSFNNFGGVQVNGGEDNMIDNNLFVDCQKVITFGVWGEKHWNEYLTSPGMVKMIHGDVDVSSPPYSTRYPDLARLTEDHDRNFVWRNLIVDSGDLQLPPSENSMDNHVGGAAPAFADPVHHNFSLNDSVYTQLGMDPIPFNQIGLYGPNRGRRLTGQPRD